MSYTPKQGNSSGGGGGNVNPNQINQQAKATLAGIANMQQQMQNLVSQSPQNPSLNAFFNLQQQNLLKQQMILQNTQFLQQLQQQQQQQQTQPPIQQNLAGKEPLALTRTPNAAELLNKTFQQQANGSAVGANLGNVAQFSQHLQAFAPNTANLMQHLQAYQYQIQQQQQQNQPHQQQNKMPQQTYAGQQNTPGHHNQQQYQQNYQQQQKFGAASSSSQQSVPTTQQQQSLNKNNQSMGNQITKPPNLPAATQITPILPPAVSASQQQQSNNNSQNKNQTKPQVTMTPTTVGKSSSQHTTNKPAGASSSFIANRSVSSPYAKAAHGHYQNSSTLNYKTGSSKLPPPTQITAVPLTKPTIATSSPIKTSMPAGSNASSPRSGHTPPAINIPPKSVTPPGSILPPNVTSLPPKGVTITPSKPSTGHPIPTSIPAPIPAAVVAASSTSTLTVPPPIQTSIHSVTPDTLMTASLSTQKPASPPKSSDVPITSKIENTIPSTSETSLTGQNKAELEESKVKEDLLKDNNNSSNDEKKEKKDGVEENKISLTESNEKKEEITNEAKKLEMKAVEVEKQPSKDASKGKQIDKGIDKKENEKNIDLKSSEEKRTASVAKDDKEKLNNETTDKKENKSETKQAEDFEIAKTQNNEDKKLLASGNIQEKAQDTVVQGQKSNGSAKDEVLVKITEKSVEIPIGKSVGKSIEKSVEKKQDDKTVEDKHVEKPVNRELLSNINKISAKSGEQETDKNAAGSSESTIKKQAESLVKDQKSNDGVKNEVKEEKSSKVEKIALTTRNTLQQQKSKNPDSFTKTEKNKAETKKKTTSLNASGTFKEATSRLKSAKSSTTALDKERNSTAEVVSPKNCNENANIVESKNKESSSETNKSDSVNSQNSAAVKALHDNSLVMVKSDTESPKDQSASSRSKRHRLKTILYQSPLPELAFITKLSASEASNSPKPGVNNEDKLVLFYKNEYLAVRNAEGGFFLCQTLHNVYKTSPRIRIRWLSEEKSEVNIYIPDFYDNTDIECVLTTVDLGKISRDRFKLPEHEKERIENILKKAIDVEKGILPRPDITEENPDGLDISLYTDESQIEKKRRNRKSPRGSSQSKKMTSTKKKSKSKSPSKTKSNVKRKRNDNDTDNSEDEDDEEENDKEYKPSHKKRIVTQSQQDQSVRRLQRSPLAKARAASPITLKKQSSKSVPQKNSDATPSSSRQSRAVKRRGTDSGIEDGTSNKKIALTPSKRSSADKNSRNSKSDENDDQPVLPDNGQNSKSGILKKSKSSTTSTATSSITSSNSSPVSEKAPNCSIVSSSTSTPPGTAIRSTRSRK